MKHTKEFLEKIIANCHSKADICRALGIVPAGGNYRIIDNYIEKHQLDISHFKNTAWNKGLKIKYVKPRSLDEILVESSSYKNTNSLRTRLIKEGIKECKCEICGILGEDVRLELHHVNGNPTDNRLENLQILCPNCHSKTENFRGKNTIIASYGRIHGKPEDYIIKDEEFIEKRNIIRKLKQRKSISIDLETATLEELRKEENNYASRVDESLKIVKVCPICGKNFESYKHANQIYCCVECYRNATKGKRPTIIQLIKDFRELKSFVQVGNKYDVTDNAVRKWCKFYGLPLTKKELFSFIEENFI